MWYTQQDQAVKDQVKRLIKNGQLEITQGGWSATDEACPSYEDLIVNMHIGHQFLFDEFGIKPRIGWMVDPFGHSQGNAAVFSDFGFEALFFSRMNYDMRRRFWKEKKMTFMWEPFSDNHGRGKQILTHIFHEHYGAPNEFNNENIQDARNAIIPYLTSLDYNLDLRCV
jgi:lysosomal alpha-mannosidase